MMWDVWIVLSQEMATPDETRQDKTRPDQTTRDLRVGDSIAASLFKVMTSLQSGPVLDG